MWESCDKLDMSHDVCHNNISFIIFQSAESLSPTDIGEETTVSSLDAVVQMYRSIMFELEPIEPKLDVISDPSLLGVVFSQVNTTLAKKIELNTQLLSQPDNLVSLFSCLGSGISN